jgi:hypothetical protein
MLKALDYKGWDLIDQWLTYKGWTRQKDTWAGDRRYSKDNELITVYLSIVKGDFNVVGNQQPITDIYNPGIFTAPTIYVDGPFYRIKLLPFTDYHNLLVAVTPTP